MPAVRARQAAALFLRVMKFARSFENRPDFVRAVSNHAQK